MIASLIITLYFRFFPTMTKVYFLKNGIQNHCAARYLLNGTWTELKCVMQIRMLDENSRKPGIFFNP